LLRSTPTNPTGMAEHQGRNCLPLAQARRISCRQALQGGWGRCLSRHHRPWMLQPGRLSMPSALRRAPLRARAGPSRGWRCHRGWRRVRPASASRPPLPWQVSVRITGPGRQGVHARLTRTGLEAQRWGQGFRRRCCAPAAVPALLVRPHLRPVGPGHWRMWPHHAFGGEDRVNPRPALEPIHLLPGEDGRGRPAAGPSTP